MSESLRARLFPAAPAVDSRLRKARWAVIGYFFLMGMLAATWAVRIPDVKMRLGLTNGQLSYALLAFGIGSIACIPFVGRLVDRFGSRLVVLVGGVLCCVVVLGPGLAPSYFWLVAALFCFGVGFNTLDVGMNAHAVEVERAYGRPIMTSFHAIYSVGGFAGSAFGGAAAALAIGALPTFAAAAVLMLVIAVLGPAWLLPPATGSSARTDPSALPVKRRGPSLAVIVLSLLAMFCFLAEGSVADWSSIYLHENLGTTAGTAAIGYAVFSITMTMGRFIGDRLAMWLGPVRLVQLSAGFGAAGMAVGLLVNQPIGAAIGFGIFGFGLASIVPQVFTATANRNPDRGGRDLGQVVGTGYAGMLLGPVAIGAAASLVTLPVALGIPVVLTVVVAILAPILRPARRPAVETAPVG
ncbi:MFS transporter [Fodinicola feengrottensis]|uniref:MFS transporter n=1 Tax=Fodinicola feengrottensis TaxID=435914 RepID=A0ABP4RP03_9ACTN|nr:MFS transporter [Fodinicola feengrottensis]